MDMNLPKLDIYQGKKELQIVLRAIKIQYVLIFFQEKVCVCNSLCLTQRLFYRTICLGLKKKIIFRPEAIT